MIPQHYCSNCAFAWSLLELHQEFSGLCETLKATLQIGPLGAYVEILLQQEVKIILVLKHQQHFLLQLDSRLLQHLVADHQRDLVSQTLSGDLKEEKERKPKRQQGLNISVIVLSGVIGLHWNILCNMIEGATLAPGSSHDCPCNIQYFCLDHIFLRPRQPLPSSCHSSCCCTSGPESKQAAPSWTGFSALIQQWTPFLAWWLRSSSRK